MSLADILVMRFCITGIFASLFYSGLSGSIGLLIVPHNLHCSAWHSYPLPKYEGSKCCYTERSRSGWRIIIIDIRGMLYSVSSVFFVGTTGLE